MRGGGQLALELRQQIRPGDAVPGEPPQHDGLTERLRQVIGQYPPAKAVQIGREHVGQFPERFPHDFTSLGAASPSACSRRPIPRRRQETPSPSKTRPIPAAIPTTGSTGTMSEVATAAATPMLALAPIPPTELVRPITLSALPADVRSLI